MKDKRYIIYNLLFIVVLLSIVIALFIILDKKNENSQMYISQEKITDECVEEAEELEKKEYELTASSTELKLSPNARLIIQKHYNGCGHTSNEYAEILPEMVNKNQEEIETEYKNFVVQAFDKNELIVSKEEKGFCGEHYILRDDNGIIVVNIVDEKGEETLYERTSIDTKYLTQTDIINLKDGIKVYGREELNSLLEDYE